MVTAQLVLKYVFSQSEGGGIRCTLGEPHTVCHNIDVKEKTKMIICVRSIQCFIDEYVLECDLFALNVLVFRSLFLKPNGTCILIRSVDSVPQ